MSAPVRGTVYFHLESGERFRFIGYSPITGRVVLHGIGDLDHADLYLVPVTTFVEKFSSADDMLAVAEAMGVAREAAGRQPVVEFTVGPDFTPSKWWTDENLAKVFGLDRATGGAS